MQRREFARNVVGAIFGTAVVPRCFEKPCFRPCIPPFQVIQPSWPSGAVDGQIFTPTFMAAWEPYTKARRKDAPAPLNCAQTIHLRDMLG